MTSSFHRTFRLFVLRWHRRIGLVLCIAIIWIASTGILLNHMHGWNLAEKLIQNNWLRQQYAVATPTYYAFNDNIGVVQTASGELLVNAQTVGVCDGAIRGAEQLQHMLVVACAHQLLLLSASGQLIEAVGPSQGLPVPIQALANDQGRLLLQASQWHVFNDSDFSFTVVTDTQAQSNQPEAIPLALQQTLNAQLQAKPISWERVLIDIHTGAFWGKGKQIISDIAAVLMMLIAVGGVWVWFTKPGRFR